VQVFSFIVTPLNNVVVNGRGPAVFNCSSNTLNVDWLFYITGSSCYIYKTFAGPGSYCTNISRHNVTPRSTNSTVVDLVIRDPQFSDGGTYVCVEEGGQQAAAVLLVIGANHTFIIILRPI